MAFIEVKKKITLCVHWEEVGFRDLINLLGSNPVYLVITNKLDIYHSKFSTLILRISVEKLFLCN